MQLYDSDKHVNNFKCYVEYRSMFKYVWACAWVWAWVQCPRIMYDSYRISQHIQMNSSNALVSPEVMIIGMCNYSLKG